MSIIITKNEILEKQDLWQVDLVGEIESKIGRKLNESDYKEILLYCLGYANDIDDIIDGAEL